MQIDSIWSADHRTSDKTQEIKTDPDRGPDNRKRPRDIDDDIHNTFETDHILHATHPRYQVRKVDIENRRIDVQVRYDCSLCLTCFSTQSDLLLHQRIHHGHPDLQQTKVCMFITAVAFLLELQYRCKTHAIV